MKKQMSWGERIAASFPITNEEYADLEKSFGQLTKYASWQLLRKNARNNHTDDFDDVNQELVMSLIRAGSYYKRQIYIEDCFRVATDFMRDGFLKHVLLELKALWKDRTRHGASRQKFGKYQEQLLEVLVKKTVPRSKWPNKEKPLTIDKSFATYCKAITWNCQKGMGRKITKEKIIRNQLTSLSEYDYLGSSY